MLILAVRTIDENYSRNYWLFATIFRISAGVYRYRYRLRRSPTSGGGSAELSSLTFSGSIIYVCVHVQFFSLHFSVFLFRLENCALKNAGRVD